MRLDIWDEHSACTILSPMVTPRTDDITCASVQEANTFDDFFDITQSPYWSTQVKTLLKTKLLMTAQYVQISANLDVLSSLELMANV